MIATTLNGGCFAVDKVLVDGKVMKLVTLADDEKGEVHHYIEDKKSPGGLKSTGDQFDTMVVHGKVKIVLNPGYRFNTVTGNFVKLPKTS